MAATPAPQPLFRAERVNALADGVFAIILTLLVLELKLPEMGEADDVLGLLAQNAHVFVAWLISFVAVARFWVVHHGVMATVRRCDSTTLTLTLSFLATASLMPFTSDTLGNARIAEPWSTALFAANIALASLTVGMLARHVARQHDAHGTGGPTAHLAGYRRHHLAVLPLVCLAAAVLAFGHPYLAVAALVAEFGLAAWRGLRGPHSHGLAAAAVARVPDGDLAQQLSR